MLYLQALGQLADGRPGIVGEASQSQQQLVLLRLQAVLAGRFRAELQEAANLVAEFRQRAVFGWGEINGHIYIVERYNYRGADTRVCRVETRLDAFF
jgi:hypothetical protein